MQPSDLPPHDSSSKSAGAAAEDTVFEQALAETETQLQQLKDRYQQVRQATQQRTQLQQRLQQLQTELQQVKERLETLELELESRLFTWSSQREVFWQFLRFAGLGFVGGLILKACTSS